MCNSDDVAETFSRFDKKTESCTYKSPSFKTRGHWWAVCSYCAPPLPHFPWLRTKHPFNGVIERLHANIQCHADDVIYIYIYIYIYWRQITRKSQFLEQLQQSFQMGGSSSNLSAAAAGTPSREPSVAVDDGDVLVSCEVICGAAIIYYTSYEHTPPSHCPRLI